MEEVLHNSSIFWVEVEKIKPNPLQPRREFDEAALQSLADSIRQYGVLQPLVVTRHEVEKPEGGISVEYELIAGERRLRACRLATVATVPVVIRSGEESDRMKLELAIIENLQREDLNPMDRARAFQRLHKEFNFKHTEIGEKVGRSREYVSNTIRLLNLPEEAQAALAAGKLSEGHCHALLMLSSRPIDQTNLLNEILVKKLTVRETERYSRRIAYDRVRRLDKTLHPEIVEIEERLSEKLGTRVQISLREQGGQVLIDFFSNDDLNNLLESINSPIVTGAPEGQLNTTPITDANPQDEPGEDLYSIKNFTV